MADPAQETPATPVAWLEHGQALEAAAQFEGAVTAYDRAIALLDTATDAGEAESRRLLGVVWMNRGNALQKFTTPPRLEDSVGAYDAAIRVFETLAWETEPVIRNHLGAAWLNRGHALGVKGDNPAAAASFQQAVSHLAKLPLETDPWFRLNLAGACTNLAYAHLADTSLASRENSRAAARQALDAVQAVEGEHEAFAAMSLRARGALVIASTDLLRFTDPSGGAGAALLSDATDAVDDGLALARAFEERNVASLRPLALQLFQLGLQVYGGFQPQFLGEFVIETLGAAALAADPNFREGAAEALAAVLERLNRPQLFVAGTREAERLIVTARSLRAAQEHLSSLAAPSSTATTPA